MFPHSYTKLPCHSGDFPHSGCQFARCRPMSLDQDKSGEPMKDVDTSKLAAMSERTKASNSAAANATSEAMYCQKKIRVTSSILDQNALSENFLWCKDSVWWKVLIYQLGNKSHSIFILLMLVACIGGRSCQSCLDQVLRQCVEPISQNSISGWWPSEKLWWWLRTQVIDLNYNIWVRQDAQVFASSNGAAQQS